MEFLQLGFEGFHDGAVGGDGGVGSRPAVEEDGFVDARHAGGSGEGLGREGGVAGCFVVGDGLDGEAEGGGDGVGGPFLEFCY